ncbi:hypothetical protein GCM10027168_00870 [Streptomyces capparidis]
MTRSAPPCLKSLPATRRLAPADVAGPPPGGRGPKVAGRQAVRSVLPFGAPPDRRAPVAWLRITAPPSGRAPSAVSWCACGRLVRATGHARVLELIEAHEDHRAACSLRHRTERTAA